MSFAIQYIPKSEKAALKAIESLDAAARQGFLEALQQVEPQLLPDECVRQVAEKSGIEPSDALRVLDLLQGLYAVRDEGEMDAESVATAIATAMEEDPDSFAPDKIATVRDFLTHALEADDTLGVTAKALNILRDHEKMFVRGRILTDLRPVFKVGTAELASAVLVHNLKIVYRTGNDYGEVYIALDNSHVDALEKVLAKARLKESVIHAFAKKAGISVLEVHE